MKSATYMIFPDNDRWHVGIVSDKAADIRELIASPDSSVVQMAKAAHELLSAEDYVGQPVHVALPTHQCLSARISLEGLPRKNRREAMLYRLEEKLPLAAEDLVADFVCNGGEAFGVAAMSEPAKLIVDALEAEGIVIHSVSPTVLLTAQQKFQHEQSNSCDALIWGFEQYAEMLLLKDDKPNAWYRLPLEFEPLQLHLNLHARSMPQPMRLCLIAVPPDIAQRVSELPNISIVATDEQEMLQSAALAAREIDRGAVVPWIQLRRDQLAIKDRYRQVRKPLSAAIAAGMFLLISFSAVFLYRAWRYEKISTRELDRQQLIFAEALPGQIVPASVSSRLISEERKLRGLSGDTGDLPAQQSALTVLANALGQLPRGLRYRLLEMRFGEDELYFDGQSLTHSDADAIAAALRKFKGFSIEPPKTEQLSGKGVAFTLIGKMTTAEEAKQR